MSLIVTEDHQEPPPPQEQRDRGQMAEQQPPPESHIPEGFDTYLEHSQDSEPLASTQVTQHGPGPKTGLVMRDENPPPQPSTVQVCTSAAAWTIFSIKM